MYSTELREQEEDILLREMNRTRPRAIPINERVNFFTVLHILSLVLDQREFQSVFHILFHCGLIKFLFQKINVINTVSRRRRAGKFPRFC